MIAELNNAVRNNAPLAHNLLKKVLRPWMKSGDRAVPVLKSYGRQKMWVHPRFMSWDLNSVEGGSQAVTAWLPKLCRAGDTVFDVGANLGWFTYLIAKLVGRNGHVVAFEPSEPNRKILEYHRRVNLLSQVRVRQEAVSSHYDPEAEFCLLQGGFSASNSLTINRPNLPRLENQIKTVTRVATTSIDEFVRSSGLRPKVIKIDVEGAEGLVLKGATETLRSHRPALILAVHPFWLPENEQTSDLVELLVSAGYQIFDESGALVNDLAFGDYLCTPVPPAFSKT